MQLLLTELLHVAGVAPQEGARRLAAGKADGPCDRPCRLAAGEHVEEGRLAASAGAHLLQNIMRQLDSNVRMANVQRNMCSSHTTEAVHSRTRLEHWQTIA